MRKFTLYERYFNKLSYILFISQKNLFWFLSYVILKFTKSGFPLKIVNLPFWVDVYPKYIFAANEM